MATIGVLDVTTRTAVTSTSVRSSRSVRNVAKTMPTKRTALAAVRHNAGGAIVADFMPTKRTASASVRSNISGPVAGFWDDPFGSFRDAVVDTAKAVVQGAETVGKSVVDVVTTVVDEVKTVKCTVPVVVHNATDNPLIAVSIIHKHSKDYKNQQQWPIIQPGKTTSDKMTVEYNTGVAAIGLDWWLITWYSPDMKTLYYSSPANFRSLFDTLESYAPDMIAGAAGVVGGLIASPTGPGAIVAGGLAAAAAKATTSVLFNSESTDGFKEHMLRAWDNKRQTMITIQPRGTIAFESHSGDSNTVYSSRQAPGK